MFTVEQIESTTELPLVDASTRSGRHEAQAPRDIRSSRHERRPMPRA
jgi:hypothetical protein